MGIAETQGDLFILGDTFMQQFYVVFDQGNHQVTDSRQWCWAVGGSEGRSDRNTSTQPYTVVHTLRCRQVGIADIRHCPTPKR